MAHVICCSHNKAYRISWTNINVHLLACQHCPWCSSFKEMSVPSHTVKYLYSELIIHAGRVQIRLEANIGFAERLLQKQRHYGYDFYVLLVWYKAGGRTPRILFMYWIIHTFSPLGLIHTIGRNLGSGGSKPLYLTVTIICDFSIV
jgi:hypothetical protein